MAFAKPSDSVAGEEIERPDLTEVLAYYGVISQKRMVPCPLHDDKTPSCSVNYSKGLWNCHSCGEAGTSWDLIMKKEGVDFKEAKDFAASHNFKDVGGGSSEQVTGSRYASHRKAPARKAASGGGYTPSWRRRG